VTRSNPSGSVMLDEVFVINLSRRPDRWDGFRARLPTGWPFGEPQQFFAVDGEATGKPDWFAASPGAWGCYRSHLAIWEQVLSQDGPEEVLILEDDATCCEGFAEEAVSFASVVATGDPSWEMLYFGGQFTFGSTREPAAFSRTISRVSGIGRTHAYAVRRQFLRRIYPRLSSPLVGATCRQDYHLDWRFRGITGSIYAPARWLMGQAADRRSDILGKPTIECWWQRAEALA
jgi:GR25 family glycosyltransferase involved in LPS biosynthesis